jgi:hypothetical protein
LTQLAEDGSIRLMTDWLYREAGQFTKVDPELWLKLLNTELWQPLKAFQANIDRARAFWRIQPYLVEHATINISKLRIAAWELTGKPFIGSEVPGTEASDAIIRARLVEQFEKRYAETGDLDVARGYDFERALNRFEDFIKADPDFQKEVFGTFTAQLVAVWIAFETLAGDLWRSILECDPEAVDNPENHSFQSLKKLRLAYEVLIPHSHRIDAILAVVDLRKLNLVRNLALHKAGIVDQQYLGDAARIQWDVPDEIGYSIKLDGVRVRELINPVIQAGIDLIQAVDDWITAKRKAKRQGEGI